MVYSFYQLLWLYMIYSFIGWCGEVVVAAVKRHRFVNRGAVSQCHLVKTLSRCIPIRQR